MLLWNCTIRLVKIINVAKLVMNRTGTALLRANAVDSIVKLSRLPLFLVFNLK